MVTRTIENKVFDAGSSEPIDVVVETHESGTVVEYRKPTTRLVMSVDRVKILADGVDEATITVTFAECSLVNGKLVWAAAKPIGDVSFSTNLRPTTVAIDASGKAVLALSTTIAGSYAVQASVAGYGEGTLDVEAIE